MHLIALLLVSCFHLSHSETCADEIARDQAEDWKVHGCRACKVLPSISAGNCPPTGYDCDAELEMTSNVLDEGCACAHLRCAQANATLAVGETLVGKLRCSDFAWTTPSSGKAESAVCARKCGLGICKILPRQFFIDNPNYSPIVIHAPDATHPCAWGTCEDGGYGSGSGGPVPYSGSVLFACSGDRTWRGPTALRHETVMCAKQCEKLNYNDEVTVCGTKYLCYEPEMENGEGVKIMTCDEPKALRLSKDADTVVAPVCSLGKWTNNGESMADDTAVMCISCPNIETVAEDPIKPETSGRNKEVSCSEGILVVEYTIGSDPPQKTNVTSLRCSDEEFVWDTTGGFFGTFSSLSAAVKAGVKWKARCQEKQPCARLPVWDAAECTQIMETSTCHDPVFSPSNVMICPIHWLALFYSQIDGGRKVFCDDIRCNTAIGEWIYYSSISLDGGVMTQAQLDVVFPRADQKFSCNDYYVPK